MLMGSERGELASSQDSKSWGKRIQSRRDIHVTPNIIIPFFNRLINLRVLPKPSKALVKWPEEGSVTESERAAINETKMRIVDTYTRGNANEVIPQNDLLTKFLDYTQEEALETLESVREELDRQIEEEQGDANVDDNEPKLVDNPPQPNTDGEVE